MSTNMLICGRYVLPITERAFSLKEKLILAVIWEEWDFIMQIAGVVRRKYMQVPNDITWLNWMITQHSSWI